MPTILDLAHKCHAVIERMEDQLDRLNRGAITMKLDGADVTKSHIETTGRIIDELRRLHGGLSENVGKDEGTPAA